MLHRANGRGLELQWSHDQDGALEVDRLAGKSCVSTRHIATPSCPCLASVGSRTSMADVQLGGGLRRIDVTTMKVHLRVVSEHVEKYTMPLCYSFKVRCVSNKQQWTHHRTLRDRADNVDDGRRQPQNTTRNDL